MMRKVLGLFLVWLIAVGVSMALPPPASAAVEAPKITLERVEVAHYWDFYLDAKEKRGSPMDLVFVFNIENPNSFNVKLEDMKFTVAFDPGFDIVTVTSPYESFYIPAETTSQLRVHATFDSYTAMLSLLVTGGFKLQELNVKAPDQLKNWWDGIKDFKFKIKVTEGTAFFTAYPGFWSGLFMSPGEEKMLSNFEAQFPK